jgi:hypothetical protein
MDLVQALCLSVITYLTLTSQAMGAATPDDALDFAKRVFRDLGDNYGNVTQTALQNQAEFDTLGPETGGLLRGLFEMRVRDLQTTLEHTLAMQEVVLLLTEGDPARP